MEKLNKLLQEQEESMARHYLSCYLKIPYDNFKKSESPDFTTIINGSNIGIEVTTVHPSEMITKADALNNNYSRKGQNKNIIEKVIKNICYNSMIKYSIYDISIRIRLDTDLYFKSYNINEKKKEIEPEIDTIFQQLKNDISSIVDRLLIRTFTYSGKYLESVYVENFHNAGWKELFEKDKNSINIYFTFQGFLDPMPFDFIQPLIAKKEEKLLTYKEKNPNIDELWLCIFLPDEEFGFTIKGLECPMGYKSNYKRIILVQNTPPFVRDL